VFLQAVSDYLWGLKRLQAKRRMNAAEAEYFESAVQWLLGRSGAITVTMAAEAMHLDLRRLSAAPHELVVREIRARKSGRRRRDDYQ
jgi:phage gp46-like protein